MNQMTERPSRRGIFLVVYARVSIVAGILNIVYRTVRGGNPVQYVLLSDALARSPGAGVLQSFLHGIARRTG
jgi:hypothetical protein